jgi:hypothetical protein
VNREILHVLRALCSELKIPFWKWPNLLPLVQGVLNSAILPRLGNRSTLTVMTGLPADHPLVSIPTSSEVRPRAVNLAENERYSVKQSSQLSVRWILCIRTWLKKRALRGKGLSTGSMRKSVFGLATSTLEISCFAAFYHVINILSSYYAGSVPTGSYKFD